MHEWALAEAVIAAATRIAEKEKLKEVKEVTIDIGELQQVERDIFQFALSQLKPVSFKNAKFQITTAKTELRCRVCEHTWLFRKQKLDENTAEAIHFVPEVAHVYIKCPKCASPDFEVTKGRGVWLESIKGAK
ncbi:MAG: hydrogenase nickel incorporation protein HypA [Candidatus Bathyarchaeota archaeon]|nr:MAG: hydrogenase nickel incorporation protein HypA [Candidatus Bathyarchaeota archaeon]